MSGRKNVLMPKKIVDSVTMATDITSSAIYAQFQDNIGLEISWSGSPSGVITIEGSNSHNPPEDSGTFYPLTFDPELAQPDGASGGYLVSLNQFPFSYYRVSYEALSGTGNLTVYATSKEI